MEAFLRALLPRLLPQDRTFEIHPFQGKSDLLGKLPARLRGYSKWPEDWRIVVVVDRDEDDCRRLKQHLEDIAALAGLSTRSRPKRGVWQLVNRIAIEELEAWYFGDWDGVRAAYPDVPDSVPRKSGFRDSDAISGGTWEAFERVLGKHGYFEGGLRKIEAARVIGAKLKPQRCVSHSFTVFRDAVLEATG